MTSSFKFIDLFAGIGGFHLAFHSLGGECVFASEIDTHARKTYEHNFRHISPALFESNNFNQDIRTISPSDIPDFDILCAGFPCQPFSQAGHKRGFNDTHKSERGNLFFHIADIIEHKRPKAFFLENVRGILNHDNGNTYKVISEILENELGYNLYTDIVRASDYGLPQLRPRAFLIGFRDEGFFKGFVKPDKLPLRYNMSDVWDGECTREIGFTIRVGGRKSNINDRRNWDSYLVDGEVKLLMPLQARMMQGFPDNFGFPVSDKEAMKQLGNSVAVDAVRAYGKAILEYLNHMQSINGENDMVNSGFKNKGEWTELYTLTKLIYDKKLMLGDKHLNKSEANFFNVTKISTLNMEEEILLNAPDTNQVNLKSSNNTPYSLHWLNEEILKEASQRIATGKGIENIRAQLQTSLGTSIAVKGGMGGQKADIILDINNETISKTNEGFSIKSYLGARPTLLNASGNTNFIYSVANLQLDQLDRINSIETSSKTKDRIQEIYKSDGKLIFNRLEQEVMQYNMELVDSSLPRLLGEMLLEFHLNRTSNVQDNLSNLFNSSDTQTLIDMDLISAQIKVKRLLVSIALGIFPGKRWDGKYSSHGIIAVKPDGDQVGLHLIDISSLEDYLFEHCSFDSPSTTRHRYGQLIYENDEQMYFKLNMQIRLN